MRVQGSTFLLVAPLCHSIHAHPTKLQLPQGPLMWISIHLTHVFVAFLSMVASFEAAVGCCLLRNDCIPLSSSCISLPATCHHAQWKSWRGNEGHGKRREGNGKLRKAKVDIGQHLSAHLNAHTLSKRLAWREHKSLKQSNDYLRYT